MKVLSILLLAGTCSQIIDVPGCGSRKVEYPCPDPSPEVSPSPIPSPDISPTPLPIPSPSPTINPLPSPTPIPTPVPSPIVPSPSPNPTPSPCKSTLNCRTCDDVLLQSIEQNNWNCPRTQGWPGRGLTIVKGEDGAPPVQRDEYNNSIGRGLCYNRGDAHFRIDRQCNRVAWDSDNILNKANSSYFGEICECNPSPSPVPTPSTPPGQLTPAGNYPLPVGWENNRTCNADYAKGKPTAYGAAYLSTVPIKPGAIYLGIRINASATPHIEKPYCEHSCYDEAGVYNINNCRNSCEQLKGCQDERGAPIYITLPGHFTNDICDEQSANKWNCHHKPKKNETGLTTFIAYPTGETPDSARVFCGAPHPKKPGFVNCYGITVDVK